MERCARERLNVKRVVVREDIAIAPRSDPEDRRGLVGCVPLYKIAGAAAAEGKGLDEVETVARRFADNMATIAVSVQGATNPLTGNQLSEYEDDEMEIGVGQHGEGGGVRQPMRSADETAKIMLDALLKDLDIKPGERVMLILNGSGATTLMELFIIYRKCVSYLNERNIEIAANHIGELLTVQEQAGFQMFMARMDEELLHYWNAPCNTPYMKK